MLGNVHLWTLETTARKCKRYVAGTVCNYQTLGNKKLGPRKGIVIQQSKRTGKLTIIVNNSCGFLLGRGGGGVFLCSEDRSSEEEGG